MEVAFGDAGVNWEDDLGVEPELDGTRNAWNRWVAVVNEMAPLAAEENEALDRMLRVGVTSSPDRQASSVVERWVDALRVFRVGPDETVQLPSPNGPEGAVELSPLRTLGRLSAAESLLLWHSGQRDEAVAGMVELLHTTGATLRNNGGLFGYLTSVAVHRDALENICRIARQSDFREADALRLGEALASRRMTTPEGLKVALRSEFRTVFAPVVSRFPESADLDDMLIAVSTLGQVVSRSRTDRRVFGVLDEVLFNRSETLELYGRPLAEFLRSLGSSWERGAWSGRFDPLVVKWSAEFGQVRDELLGYDGGDMPTATVAHVRFTLGRIENPMGKLFVMVFAAPIEGVSRTAYVAETQARAARILVALRARLLFSQEAPHSLLELDGVCSLNAEADLCDPLGTGTFGYDRDRLLIWSVGRDGIDDGGIGDGRNEGNSPDLVWSLPMSLATPGG